MSSEVKPSEWHRIIGVRVVRGISEQFRCFLVRGINYHIRSPVSEVTVRGR